LLDPKRGTGQLAEELGPQNPKQANLVCYLFSFGDIVIYIAEFYNGIFPPADIYPYRSFETLVLDRGLTHQEHNLYSYFIAYLVSIKSKHNVP